MADQNIDDRQNNEDTVINISNNEDNSESNNVTPSTIINIREGDSIDYDTELTALPSNSQDNTDNNRTIITVTESIAENDSNSQEGNNNEGIEPETTNSLNDTVISSCVHNNEENQSSTNNTQCGCNCHSQQNSLSFTNRAFNASQVTLMEQNTVETEQRIQDTNLSSNYKEIRSVPSFKQSSSISLPKYSHLGEFILNDEPPKYEEVTGNQLATQLDTTAKDQRSAHTVASTRQQQSNGNLKRRIAGAGIFLAVLVVTVLLIYLSVTGATSKQQQESKK